LQPFRPGQRELSAKQLNKLVELASAGFPGQPGAGHGGATFNTPQGSVVLPPYPPYKFAKITGIHQFNSGDSGNDRNCANVAYSWVVQHPAQCGRLEDGDNSEFESGSEIFQTAFEANGVTDVPIGSFVILWEGFNSDTNLREWLFFWGGPGASQAVIKVLGSTIPGVNSGCLSGADPLHCPLKFYLSVTQTYDPACDIWRDGRCVLLADIEGRNLEIDKRYIGYLITHTTNPIHGNALPVDSPCQAGDYVVGTPFYVTDLGTPTRSVLVQSEIGQLCYESGSDSETSQGLLTDNSNLTIYAGVIQVWNAQECIWETTDSEIYVAEMHGCTLEIGRHYEAHYENIIPSFNSGSYSETCISLYLVDHVPSTPRGVADIRCINGQLKVYVWQATNNCGQVAAVFSHNAGCCDCSGGEGSGGDGSGSDPACCGGRSIGPLYATIPGVGTIALSFDGLWWVGSATAPCGRTLFVRWSNCVAQYSCDGSHWAALGSALGAEDDCGPPFVSRPWDGANMDGGSTGCEPPPDCGTINGIIFSE